MLKTVIDKHGEAKEKLLIQYFFIKLLISLTLKPDTWHTAFHIIGCEFSSFSDKPYLKNWNRCKHYSERLPIRGHPATCDEFNPFLYTCFTLGDFVIQIRFESRASPELPWTVTSGFLFFLFKLDVKGHRAWFGLEQLLFTTVEQVNVKAP